MRKVGIAILVILVVAGIVHFMGVTVSTLIVFVIAAFVGGFLLGRRRRAHR